MTSASPEIAILQAGATAEDGAEGELWSDNRIKPSHGGRDAKSFKGKNFNLCNIRYFGFSADGGEIETDTDGRTEARERERERDLIN